jgi:hypothetical protein
MERIDFCEFRKDVFTRAETAEKFVETTEIPAMTDRAAARLFVFVLGQSCSA